MRSPIGSSVVLGTHLIGTKDLIGSYSKFLQDGVTLFGSKFFATRSRLKEFLGMSLWRHIAVPPPLFNVGTCVLYINHSGNVY